MFFCVVENTKKDCPSPRASPCSVYTTVESFWRCLSPLILRFFFFFFYYTSKDAPPFDQPTIALLSVSSLLILRDCHSFSSLVSWSDLFGGPLFFFLGAFPSVPHDFQKPKPQGLWCFWGLAVFCVLFPQAVLLYPLGCVGRLMSFSNGGQLFFFFWRRSY